MTGPGKAASTLTWTPKSASFLSIRRDVYSSVSALTVSVTGGAGSSRCSGGNWPPNTASGKSTACFSRSTRASAFFETGTSTGAGVSMMIGS